MKGRVQEGKTETSSTHWFTVQMVRIAVAGQTEVRSQELLTDKATQLNKHPDLKISKGLQQIFVER